jgi:serine/threonine-protein kinase
MGAQTDPQRQSLPPAGTVLGGRYRLTRLVAAGGMGAVFEARDEREGRDVALKLLHRELTSERDVRRRFRRESSVLLALDHPCVVRVLDIGTSDDELLFSVMELLEGETLHARLERERGIAAADLVPVVQGIADGLSAAHAHGVIHGDLKPANVFLLAEPGDALPVKLLDFGLSKVLGLERLTRTGELIGTPAYMAPELLTGKGELDERIDTYAFGVILYQCLAGEPPFRGKVPGKLMMDIVMGDAPALTEQAPDVPADVAAVVRQAMSRQRERRFGSATALARAYRSALGLDS